MDFFHKWVGYRCQDGIRIEIFIVGLIFPPGIKPRYTEHLLILQSDVVGNFCFALGIHPTPFLVGGGRNQTSLIVFSSISKRRFIIAIHLFGLTVHSSWP